MALLSETNSSCPSPASHADNDFQRPDNCADVVTRLGSKFLLNEHACDALGRRQTPRKATQSPLGLMHQRPNFHRD